MFVDGPDYGSVACVILAVFMYFFFTSSFFWMLVIAFDVWRTLRASATQLRLTAGKQWKKFGVYSLVGWGSSALLTLAIILIDSLEIFRSKEFEKPGVGMGKCFLQDKAVGVYLHLPSMVVMLLNAILFLITTATIYRYGAGTDFWGFFNSFMGIEFPRGKK